MAMQRKKRGQDQMQPPVSVKSSNSFVPFEPESAASKGSSTELARDSATLELRRKQASQSGFNFGNVPLFASAVTSNPSLQHRSQPLLLQTKLTVSTAGDQYEQAADRVASQVVGTIHSPEANSPVQQKAEDGKGEGLQRKSLEAIQRAAVEEELQMQPTVQRMGMKGGSVSHELEAEIQREKGKGKTLEPNLQRQMGQAMGADLSGVKIHTDARAGQLSQSVQAKAFTTGKDIFFRQGAYDPGSKGGQKLIAHELTHVVQQTGNAIEPRAGTAQRQPPNVLQREGNDKDEQPWGQNVTVDGKTYPWVVPLHGNAYANAGKTLSGGEDVLPPTPDLQDKVGNQPQRLGFNPGKYPNITSDALRTYSEEVLGGDLNGQESLSARVGESDPQIGYKFNANESGSIYSIHLSPGNLFATLTPAAQVEDMKGFMQARGALAGGKVAKNQVTEHCPQHCGTHYPGTPPSGSHMHHYNSGGMPMKNVANALKVAEAMGTITAEGANNARQAMGLPVPDKPQQDK